jgi:hypothetical protein
MHAQPHCHQQLPQPQTQHHQDSQDVSAFFSNLSFRLHQLLSSSDSVPFTLSAKTNGFKGYSLLSLSTGRRFSGGEVGSGFVISISLTSEDIEYLPAHPSLLTYLAPPFWPPL